jgi:hypothetical protein
MSGPSSSSLAIDEEELPIFLRKEWVNVAHGNRPLVTLTAEQNGTIVGRLSYIVKPILPGIEIAGSPYFSPYGGVTLSSALSDSQKLNVARTLLLQLPKKISIEFQCPSHTPDAPIIRRAYEETGFSITGNKTCVLHPEQQGIFVLNAIDRLGLQARQEKTSKKGRNPTGVGLHFSDSVSTSETGESLSKARAHIRNADNALEVVSLSPEEFVKVYETNLQGQGKTSNQPFSTLRNLVAYGLASGNVRIFAARKKIIKNTTDEPAIDAAIACAYDHERCYVWRMTVRKHQAENGEKSHPHAAKLVLVYAMRDARMRGLVFDTDGGGPGQTEVLYPRLRISDIEYRMVAARYTPTYFVLKLANNVVKSALRRTKSLKRRFKKSSRELGRLKDDRPEFKHAASSKFMVPFNLGETGRPPLYLVHALMGDVGSFKHIPKFLALEEPFFGIQMPKAIRTETSARSIEQMAEMYVGELNKFQPSGPLVLGGWFLRRVGRFGNGATIAQTGTHRY